MENMQVMWQNRVNAAKSNKETRNKLSIKWKKFRTTSWMEWSPLQMRDPYIYSNYRVPSRSNFFSLINCCLFYFSNTMDKYHGLQKNHGWITMG